MVGLNGIRDSRVAFMSPRGDVYKRQVNDSTAAGKRDLRKFQLITWYLWPIFIRFLLTIFLAALTTQRRTKIRIEEASMWKLE